MSGGPLLEGVLDVGRAAARGGIARLRRGGVRAHARLFERAQAVRPRRSASSRRCSTAPRICYCEIEMTRAVVLPGAAGARCKDADGREPVVASPRRAPARRATLAVQEAVQMHGGIGMTDELDIGLFMKRARVAARAVRRRQLPRRSPGAAEAILTTMPDAAAKAWPVISLAEADARLNVPGSPFEWEEIDIRGVKTRVWKNAPRTLRDILLNGRAAFAARTFLVYQDDRTTFEGFARAALTIAHRRCRKAYKRRSRCDRHAQSAGMAGGFLRRDPRRCDRDTPQCVVDRAGARICAAGFWRQDRFPRFRSVTSASPNTCTICPIFSASSFAAPPSPSHIRM